MKKIYKKRLDMQVGTQRILIVQSSNYFYEDEATAKPDTIEINTFEDLIKFTKDNNISCYYCNKNFFRKTAKVGIYSSGTIQIIEEKNFKPINFIDDYVEVKSYTFQDLIEKLSSNDMIQYLKEHNLCK